MYKCNECGKEFEKVKSMCIHRQKQHGILSEDTYIELMLNGETPKCKCGCNETPKYLSGDKGFRAYVLGHAARINNNWGHNSEVIKKSHATQKKMYDKGELIIWNKGLTVDDPRVKDNIDKVMANPERGKNISKKLTGKLKSEKHKEKLRESQIVSWSNPEKREKQSRRQIKQLLKNNYRNKKTKLEIKFDEMLNFLNLNNEYQYVVDLGMFDFYLLDYNILIEVDGDFHHCNPNSKHWEVKYPIQINTNKNDIRKNKIAEDNNIKLLRFWESDINNTPEDVINILVKELNL